MKIIVNGPEHKKTIRFNLYCMKCESIVEASEPEVRRSYDVKGDEVVRWECPVCGHHNV